MRGLKSIVVIMGILIVVGLSVVVFTLVARPKKAPLTTTPQNITIHIGKDHIKNVSINGNYLLIQSTNPQQETLRLFDLQTGQKQTIYLTP